MEFVKKQENSLDFPVSIHYSANDKNPIVVITWIESQTNLSSIVLDSHM